jgi:hypothetical protein
MLISPETLRILLFYGLLSMLLLAVFYLRRRRLSFGQYLCWGLLIVLIPLLGPFLAVLSRPGEPGR